jgi:hypothetical protein
MNLQRAAVTKDGATNLMIPKETVVYIDLDSLNHSGCVHQMYLNGKTIRMIASVWPYSQIGDESLELIKDK